MEEHMRQYVPPEYQGKVLVCDVGPDVYGSSQHPTLRLKINDWLRQCLVYLNTSREVKKG